MQYVYFINQSLSSYPTFSTNQIKAFSSYVFNKQVNTNVIKFEWRNFSKSLFSRGSDPAVASEYFIKQSKVNNGT